MSAGAEPAAAWVYRGVWKVLSGWFRVPAQPPTLPAEPGAFSLSFHPSRAYLRYLKLYFWVGCVAIDLAILAAWLVVFVSNPRWGIALAGPALALAVLPDIVAYVAVHLRYDTMWYVMTDRSLRCRRGIWTILEHTITFENVQNVRLARGPIQYLYGVQTIVIETAGAAEGQHENKFAAGNKAILEGIDNPEEIRRLILERVRHSKSAGLGDEPLDPRTPAPGLGPAHVRALQQILDAARGLG